MCVCVHCGPCENQRSMCVPVMKLSGQAWWQLSLLDAPSTGEPGAYVQSFCFSLLSARIPLITQLNRVSEVLYILGFILFMNVSVCWCCSGQKKCQIPQSRRHRWLSAVVMCWELNCVLQKRVAVSASKHWAVFRPRCYNSNGTLLLCFSLFMGSHHQNAKKSFGNTFTEVFTCSEAEFLFIALVGLLHISGCSET